MQQYKQIDAIFQTVGEWWKADVEAVIYQATQLGMPPNISDAHTINGYPGPVPNCLQGNDSAFIFFDICLDSLI